MAVLSQLKAVSECDVCRNNFNSGENLPKLMPHCGHTICITCLIVIGQTQGTRCPSCRSSYKENPINFPTNSWVLQLADHVIIEVMGRARYQVYMAFKEPRNYGLLHDLRHATLRNLCEHGPQGR